MAVRRLKRLEELIRTRVERIDELRIPFHLKQQQRPVPQGVDEEWASRLRRFRSEIVPWLDSTRPLKQARILEIGSGSGASTASLAEQGALVTGIDLDAPSLDQAVSLLTSMGLSARF